MSVFALATVNNHFPNVCLYESNGVTGISGGVVKYYDQGWKDFGITGSDGCVEKDILKKNYTFRMTYANGSVDKTQDVSANPLVIFQTVDVHSGAERDPPPPPPRQYFGGTGNLIAILGNATPSADLWLGRDPGCRCQPFIHRNPSLPPDLIIPSTTQAVGIHSPPAIHRVVK